MYSKSIFKYMVRGTEGMITTTNCWELITVLTVQTSLLHNQWTVVATTGAKAEYSCTLTSETVLPSSHWVEENNQE